MFFGKDNKDEPEPYDGARTEEAFVEYLVQTKEAGGVYDANAVNAQMIEIGKQWDNGTWGTAKGEGWGTQGDSYEVAARLIEKWA